MRASGILMPISSLPSPYGIGTMGAAARSFVDFLVKAGQAYWRILPVCPPPATATVPISRSRPLRATRILSIWTIWQSRDCCCRRICVHRLGMHPRLHQLRRHVEKRYAVLRCAAKRLLEKPGADYRRFVKENDFWLPDYALFIWR